MDPEIYVFPKINSAGLKIGASTALFIVVFLAAQLLLSRFPGPSLWSGLGLVLKLGSFSVSAATLLHIILGYMLFIYGSYHAWRATREKNSVEDSQHPLATRILDTGYYGCVRHPMYGMFIMANVGLGFALSSIYGLIFGLLSLVLFFANGIFEEKFVMLRFFGAAYQDYMNCVTARYFTPTQALVVTITLGSYIAGLLL